jgi:hypothetical protein
LDKEAKYLLVLKGNQPMLFTEDERFLGPEISRQCQQETLLQEADY